MQAAFDMNLPEDITHQVMYYSAGLFIFGVVFNSLLLCF
jgi:hypothetical protein